MDVMIFKRFTPHRKMLNFVIFVKRKCFKAISSVKAKVLETLVLNIYTGLGYFIFYFTTIYKVYVDLVNERQHNTQGFLRKIREPHEINLSRTMSASRKLQLLESDWITRFMSLCFSVYPFGIYICWGTITR